MARLSDSRGDDVRIGPISLFTLITVICLAVLAVLAFSTASATHTMTVRQAEATTELYLDEAAAQEFMAGLADELADARAAGVSGQQAIAAVSSALPSLCSQAIESSSGMVNASATMVDNAVHADFTCENGRTLTIVVTIRDNATFRIDKWKMTAVQNEEEPAGNLWTGD